MCIGDAPYLLLWRGNSHQGLWILTRWKLQMLERKCEFLQERGRCVYVMSSYFTLSLNINPTPRCATKATVGVYEQLQ